MRHSLNPQEPVTEEWLKELGFVQNLYDKEGKLWRIGMPTTSPAGDEEGAPVYVVVDAPRSRIYLEIYGLKKKVCSFTELPGNSRWHVIRLCLSLGIELKDKTKDVTE